MTTVIYNDTYSTSTMVEQMHQLPHLSSSLTTEDNTFDITVDSTWNSYTRSLLPLPLILMALALLSVVVFQCATCCAACCRKPNQAPVQTSGLWNCRIAFFFALAVVLLFDQSLIFGSKYLGDGVSTADDGLDFVGNTFTLLDNYGSDLTADGDALQEDFTNSANINNCDEAATLNDYMDDYFTYVDEYTSLVSDVPGKVNDAQDALHKYGVDYKNKTIWVFYGMFIVCLGIYALGMLCSSKLVVFAGMTVTDCVQIFTFLLCGVQMIILVSTSDSRPIVASL